MHGMPYVKDIRDTLDLVCQVAKENLKEAKGRQAPCYDFMAKPRQFTVGDNILLLSQKHNKQKVT